MGRRKKSTCGETCSSECVAWAQSNANREPALPAVRRRRIVALEGGNQNVAHLIEVVGGFELLDRAPHREIINDDLALFDRPLGNAAEFAKFQIVQMLHP